MSAHQVREIKKQMETVRTAASSFQKSVFSMLNYMNDVVSHSDDTDAEKVRKMKDIITKMLEADK